ncbi:hypothetical protein BH11PLA1_BH11PLA1_23860 [soil metagenome]
MGLARLKAMLDLARRRAAGVAAMAMLGAAAAHAGAQSAPAGNTAPREVVSAPGTDAETNPFGAPAPSSTLTAAEKHAFAEKVDVGPLRDLAVAHAGRVKIIDSLARETVMELAGRRDFYEIAAEGSAGAGEGGVYGASGATKKFTYDPVFTLMDVVIDPAYYAERPLIAVNFLPLREEILRAEFPGSGLEDAQLRETWKKIGRVTPGMLARHLGAVASQARIDQPSQRALRDVHEGLDIYRGAAANLAMVPAATTEEPWLSLSRLPAGSPAAVAVKALGAAWRAGDAAAANAAILTLARELPALRPEMYPQARRTLERTYNAARPFEWGMWLYGAAFLALILAFGTGRVWLRRTGLVLLVAAIAVHGAGFAARCFIAERYSIQNQFESMTGMSLFAALVGLGLLVAKRQAIFAAAAAGVGFLVLTAATQTAIPGREISREAAILNTSVLLKYHVTTVLVSYALITLGMVVSAFYLATHYAARARARAIAARDTNISGGAVALAGGGLHPATFDVGSAPVAAAALSTGARTDGTPLSTGTARVLHDLDRAQMTVLQLAFWGLGVGILLGAWWADHSWGRWWAFDPKETFALVTWIVYLIVIHIRVAMSGDRGLATAWLSLVGFVAMLWCYFGVNLLLPGLHAYA